MHLNLVCWFAGSYQIFKHPDSLLKWAAGPILDRFRYYSSDWEDFVSFGKYKSERTSITSGVY